MTFLPAPGIREEHINDERYADCESGLFLAFDPEKSIGGIYHDDIDRWTIYSPIEYKDLQAIFRKAFCDNAVDNIIEDYECS